MNTDKKCQQCIHYAPPRVGYGSGRCGYPVVGYLKAANPGFVSGFEASDCGFYITPQRVAATQVPVGP